MPTIARIRTRRIGENWQNWQVVGETSRYHSLTSIFGEQTAQACANACFRQLTQIGGCRMIDATVISFADLTEADALSDGFHSLTELHETLLDLLPNAREVSLCRIRFERI
jgi:hypothetical protein